MDGGVGHWCRLGGYTQNGAKRGNATSTSDQKMHEIINVESELKDVWQNQGVPPEAACKSIPAQSYPIFETKPL